MVLNIFKVVASSLGSGYTSVFLENSGGAVHCRFRAHVNPLAAAVRGLAVRASDDISSGRDCEVTPAMPTRDLSLDPPSRSGGWFLPGTAAERLGNNLKTKDVT